MRDQWSVNNASCPHCEGARDCLATTRTRHLVARTIAEIYNLRNCVDVKGLLNVYLYMYVYIYVYTLRIAYLLSFERKLQEQLPEKTPRQNRALLLKGMQHL